MGERFSGTVGGAAMVTAVVALFAVAAPAALADPFGKLDAPSITPQRSARATPDQTDRTKPMRARDCLPKDLSSSCKRAMRRAGMPLTKSSLTMPEALAVTFPPTDTKTSPHGDTLSLSRVYTGVPFDSSLFADYWNGQNFVLCGGGGSAFLAGDEWDPCADISFNDAQTGTVTSTNNSAVATVYDSCGNVIGGSTTFGWYRSDDPNHFYSPATVGGLNEFAPYASCAGAGSLVYSFTQTFASGDTLTVTAGTTISFFPQQTLTAPQETYGGGNPAMLGGQQACCGDPVNTATGDYFESATDLSIAGRGPGLSMERTYSSLAAGAGKGSSLGPGWTFNYNMSLAIDSGSGTATVRAGNGSETVFTTDGATYAAPPRVLAKLVKNADGTFTYTVRKRTIYTFSTAGKLTQIADLDGEKTTLAYNGTSGRLQTATDGAGRTLTFGFDANGKLSTVADSTGRTVTYDHDPATGDLTRAIDVRGKLWDFTYDTSHLLLTRKDGRRNVVMTNTYDASGRALTQKDGLNHTTTWAYTGNPSTSTQVTDRNAHVTKFDYSDGLLVTETRALGTSKQASWSYSYDTRGALGVTSVTDPNNHMKTFTYDAQGNELTATDANNHQTVSAYDALNDLTSFKDKNGIATSYTYDAKGNLLTKATPLDGTTTQTTTYVHATTAHPGDITSIKDPLNNATTYSYAATTGDLLSATDPAGSKTTYTYNTRGQRLTMVSPKGNVTRGTPSQFTTTYTYDAAGNLLTETDPLTHVTTNTYDDDGNLASVKDPRNNLTSYTYDANNRRTKITRADTTTLFEGYDDEGNLTSQTDGATHATTYAYDALDHLQSVTDPLARSTSFIYDAVGNLKSATDPLTRTTNYGYDQADQLTATDMSDPATPDVGFGYDNDGRRTSMTDGTGSSSFTYDALGRLKTATDGRNTTITYGYDIANRQTSVVYPGNKTLTRTYDTASRMATLTDWLGGKTTFGYDSNSNLASTTWPTASKNVDTVTYNNADEQTNVSMAKGNTTLATIASPRDANGQVASETPTGVPGPAQTYTYNSLNQLTQAGTKTYAYDAADNPTTFASTAGFGYDAANQLGSGAANTYTFNAMGERTKLTPATGPVVNYAYNQAGQLVSSGAATTTVYSYDGSGNRFSKSTGANSAAYTWDRSFSPAPLLSDGGTLYIYGPDGLPTEQVSTAGVAVYYHRDQLGSTRMLTSAAGAIVGSFSYDAYGKLSGSSGTVTTPLGFAGEYTDSETGLQYLRARYYDPSTAQFISRDPALQQTRQAYGYAGQNPLNAVDPTGLLCIGKYCLGFHPVEGLKGGVNFVAGLGNAAVSTLSLGHVHIPQPFCGGLLGTSYAIGGTTAGIAAGAVGGEVVGVGTKSLLTGVRIGGAKLGPIVAPFTGGAAGSVAQSTVQGNPPTVAGVSHGAGYGLIGELATGGFGTKHASGVAGAAGAFAGLVGA